MTNNLNTLAAALYVKIHDELKASPQLARWRPSVGIKPALSDAELVTLVVMSALLGYTSERPQSATPDRPLEKHDHACSTGLSVRRKMVIMRQASGALSGMSPWKSPYWATVSRAPDSRTAAASSVAVQKR